MKKELQEIARAELRTCKHCGRRSFMENFKKSKTTLSGVVNVCKWCANDKQKAYRIRSGYENPKLDASGRQRKADLNLERKYGITADDYNKMSEMQNHVCKICGKKEPHPKRTRLSVDHCHKTKAVRGLLCSRCNYALGHFNDDVAMLKSAIDYLEQPPYMVFD